MRNCFEKFLELVAQAFQPVRINEAGEDARPTIFHNFRGSQWLMRNCSDKLKKYAVSWWGGRLWPPFLMAGTEARPTSFFIIYGWANGP